VAGRQVAGGRKIAKQLIMFKNIKTLSAMLVCVAGTITACDSNFTKERTDTMNVKVISLEKCSATPPTIALVEEVAREMGLTITLEHRVIKTREEALAYRHIGSPTIQINGNDIDPGARQIKQFGVT
jgi:hypothetical protein